MISICIPIYNKDVSGLVEALQEQITRLNVPVEIFLLDDGSDDHFEKMNRKLEKTAFVNYSVLPANVGRSKIRNILADKASFPYLLYLDCDTQIVRKDFIDSYFTETDKHSVVCGGHIYGERPDKQELLLHWLAGSKREMKPLHLRKKRPYHSFMTGNFMIKRSVFKNIRFREDLRGYGHEDTLFGYDLKKKGVSIHHIDNPIEHTGLENADNFIMKTREGLQNLLISYKITGYDASYANMIKILQTYRMMRRIYMCKPFSAFYKVFEKPMLANLKGRKPCLWVFDLYKLGNLCRASANPPLTSTSR